MPQRKFKLKKKVDKRSKLFQFHGPIVPRYARDNERSVIATMNSTSFTIMTSSVAGVIQTTIPLYDPSASTDFAGIAANWDNCRVLAVKIEYFPDNRYSKAATVCRPIVGVIDINDNTALTGYGQAVNYESYRMLSLEDRWSMEFRIRSDNPTQMTYQPTVGAAFPAGSFKFFGSALSLSTEYGMMIMTYVVEFVGQR